MGTTQNNISEVSGQFTGTTMNGLDGWETTVDLQNNPSVTSVGGNFNVVSNGSNQGDPRGISYQFSALSTNEFGTLSYNTSNGTFTFTFNKTALNQAGTDQTISFTVRGLGGSIDDTDTVTIRVLICVARGTLIATPEGEVPVETLSAGDEVTTADGIAKPLLWIGSRLVGAAELERNADLRPIRIREGALGTGLPVRDLVVSPQHRVLVRGWRAELFFGEDELLVPARALVNDRDVLTDRSMEEVEYFHMLLDRHEIILTDGLPTESFDAGGKSVDALAVATQTEIRRLFPEVADAVARPVLTVREGSVFAQGPRA